MVTGASGFIGAAVGRHLRTQGALVHGLSRRPPPPEAVDQWSACDIVDVSQVRSTLLAAAPEIVIHLAGTVAGAADIDLVLPNLHCNLTGFIHVAMAAAELGCRHVVHVGSLREPDESLPPVPSSPYGAAKFAASAYARMFAEVFSIPITVARPMMVYGPGQGDFTKLVPYVLRRLSRGELAELSTGTQAYDWVYIDDVAEALVLIAAHGERGGRPIDIGCGILTSVREVVLGLAQRLGAEHLLRFGAIRDRPEEPTRTADVERTSELVGWRARVGLEEGLDRSVEVYRALGASGEA